MSKNFLAAASVVSCLALVGVALRVVFAVENGDPLPDAVRTVDGAAAEGGSADGIHSSRTVVSRGAESIDDAASTQGEVEVVARPPRGGRFAGIELVNGLTLDSLDSRDLTNFEVERACAKIQALEQQLFDEMVRFYGDVSAVAMTRGQAETLSGNGLLIARGVLPGPDVSIVFLPCPDHLAGDLKALGAGFVTAASDPEYSQMIEDQTFEAIALSYPEASLELRPFANSRGFEVFDQSGRVVATKVVPVPGFP